jgi:hypothetical protein
MMCRALGLAKVKKKREKKTLIFPSRKMSLNVWSAAGDGDDCDVIVVQIKKKYSNYIPKGI